MRQIAIVVIIVVALGILMTLPTTQKETYLLAGEPVEFAVVGEPIFGTLTFSEQQDKIQLLRKSDDLGKDRYYLGVALFENRAYEKIPVMPLSLFEQPHGIIIRNRVINVYYSNEPKDAPFTDTTPVKQAFYYQISEKKITDVTQE